MKNMKRIFSLVLALVMMMALTVAAGANSAPVSTDNPDPAPTGTITVTNAAKGETYKLVQLFKASYNKDTGSIVYTGTIPTDALTITVKGGDGNDTTKTVYLTDYFTQKDGYVVPVDGTYTGADNNKRLGDEAVKAITAWANQESVKGTELTATSNSVTFEGLTDGYYVVVSRVSNGGAVSVTSIAPHPTIEDKNTTGNTPYFPEKGKVVKDKDGNEITTVAVGETVTYTVTYNTVNWIEDDKGAPNSKVYNYVFKDTLPDFLSQVTVTSITVTEKGAGEGGSDKVTPLTTQQFKDGMIKIDWTTTGNENGESLYNNGAVLTITYTAVVTDKILEDNTETEEHHTNKIQGGPNGKVLPDGAESDLYTATVTVDKVVKGEPSKKLEGAVFMLTRMAKVDDPENPGTLIEQKQYYSRDESTKAVTWDPSEAKASKLTTNKDGKVDFTGIRVGDFKYQLVEVTAPKGYNKLNDPVDVTVTATGELKANISKTEQIGNATGTELPATGGIGTTIFTVTGGLLMIGAAILFLTKKRSEG